MRSNAAISPAAAAALLGENKRCVLAMMIPPAMDLATMKIDGKFDRRRLVLDCIVICVGVGGLLGGSLASLLEIAGVDVNTRLLARFSPLLAAWTTPNWMPGSCLSVYRSRRAAFSPPDRA